MHLLRGAAQDKMLRLHESVSRQKLEADAIISSCHLNRLALRKQWHICARVLGILNWLL